MKKILLFLIMIPFVFALENINALVTDEAGVLSAEEKSILESLLLGIQNSGMAEFAVVTVSSLEGVDIESYAFNLADGTLGDPEKNNGLLLLLSVEDREYRIEVGRGLEPILPDGKVGRIGRDYLVENFQAENYGKGIIEATAAISQELGVEQTQVVIPQTPSISQGANFFSLFLWFFILFSIVGSIGGRRYQYRKRDRFFDAALMAGLLFGGRRGGSLGGGFGGFGGGGFGGGGAGGSF